MPSLLWGFCFSYRYSDVGFIKIQVVRKDSVLLCGSPQGQTLLGHFVSTKTLHGKGIEGTLHFALIFVRFGKCCWKRNFLILCLILSPLILSLGIHYFNFNLKQNPPKQNRTCSSCTGMWEFHFFFSLYSAKIIGFTKLLAVKLFVIKLQVHFAKKKNYMAESFSYFFPHMTELYEKYCELKESFQCFKINKMILLIPFLRKYIEFVFINIISYMGCPLMEFF